MPPFFSHTAALAAVFLLALLLPCSRCQPVDQTTSEFRAAALHACTPVDAAMKAQGAPLVPTHPFLPAEESLRAQTQAITNWPEFKQANNFSGWDFDTAPTKAGFVHYCNWTGIACTDLAVTKL